MGCERLELGREDITIQSVDAIVNAANSQLRHGGGVARAIADAAGPDLVRESEAHPFVGRGQAGHTGPGRLPCRFVIHAVGPRWRGGGSGEGQALAGAYRASMRLAARLGCRSVAFPSISTGIFGCPVRWAAPIALSCVAEELEGEAQGISLVRFCLPTPGDLAAYERARVKLGI
jgi:O-acetyl-ADP-ribose deacetylase (regulator of RNase III)